MKETVPVEAKRYDYGVGGRWEKPEANPIPGKLVPDLPGPWDLIGIPVPSWDDIPRPTKEQVRDAAFMYYLSVVGGAIFGVPIVL